MARGKRAKERKIKPDLIFNSTLVTKLINRVMQRGKKQIAQKLVYDALSIIKEKKLDPLLTLGEAMNNISPKTEVRPRRVGGASYQVPTEVRGPRRLSLGIRWLVMAANKRSNKEYHFFSQKLAAELMDAAKGEGEAVKRRNTVTRMAEANKAFSHFRW